MLACYLARGRVSKKFLYVDPNMMITVLAAAMRGGMPSSAINKAIDDNETLEGLCTALGVDSLEYEEMFGGRQIDQKKMVLVCEHQPEWRAWQSYLLKTRGKGTAMNKQFGWYFPTQWPPGAEGTPGI